jgi:hypothetical protein
MPQGKDLCSFRFVQNPIVEVVTDPIQKNPANSGEPGMRNSLPG